MTLIGFPNGISISSYMCDCSVQLRNVRLEGRKDGGGIGLVIDGISAKGAVGLSHIDVQGYRKAIEIGGVIVSTAPLDYEGAPVVASDLGIDCREDGIEVRGAIRWSATDLEISNCIGTAIEMNFSAALELKRAKIRDNGFGLHSVRGSPETLSISDSLFEGNGIAIRTEYSPLKIQRSQFFNNGRPDGPKAPSDATPGAIISVLAGGEIHRSSFVGNHNFGILSPVSTVAAQDNWWGSAYGPRVVVQRQALGPGGDPVAGRVDFVPFLTQSPD